MHEDEDEVEAAGSDAESNGDVIDIPSVLTSLQSEIKALHESVARLDERLDNVVAGWTTYREDLDTAESEAHRTLADQYTNFVEQSLYGLARKAVEAKGDGIRGEVVAGVVRKLCTELFGRAEISEQRVRRVLAVRAADELAETVRKAVAQGLSIVAASRRMKTRGIWEFDHVPGAAVDPSQQQVWGRCDASEPVKFVVAPAYVVGRTSYCRQWVHTAS